MPNLKHCLFLLIYGLTLSCSQDEATVAPPAPKAIPPYDGTIFLDPDIITEDDHSTFSGLAYVGQELRTMYDRRVSDWVEVNAFLFDANFDDGLKIEVQVNSEFETSELAEIEAIKYAESIGRLPNALRQDVETVWIHKGTEPFGGGNHNILIHIGQADLYVADGILEETFVHEASHTSLDAAHAASAGWLNAQAEDGNFISTYARDNPQREDIAETFLLYMAIRYRGDRISLELKKTVEETVPHRIKYFDTIALNMYPIEN